MAACYDADVHIDKQQDGLWRLSVPGLQGGWVDAKTLEEGFADLQEAIALMITCYLERGWVLPESVKVREGPPSKTHLPVLLEEYTFTSPKVTTRSKSKR